MSSDARGLGFLSTATSGDSEPLTLEMLREAMDKVTKAQTEQLLTNAHNASRLMEATPEHLRNHPFIVNLATLIGGGHIFHPEDAKAARAEWERLCKEQQTP